MTNTTMTSLTKIHTSNSRLQIMDMIYRSLCSLLMKRNLWVIGMKRGWYISRRMKYIHMLLSFKIQSIKVMINTIKSITIKKDIFKIQINLAMMELIMVKVKDIMQMNTPPIFERKNSRLSIHLLKKKKQTFLKRI